jgi:hypothetical protein
MITISEFRRRVAELDGERLVTGRQKRGFTVRVNTTGLEYTPESTGKRRPDSWERIERVLDHYNETHSMTRGDYTDITRNGSYVLAILQRLLK